MCTPNPVRLCYRVVRPNHQKYAVYTHLVVSYHGVSFGFIFCRGFGLKTSTAACLYKNNPMVNLDKPQTLLWTVFIWIYWNSQLPQYCLWKVALHLRGFFCHYPPWTKFKFIALMWQKNSEKTQSNFPFGCSFIYNRFIYHVGTFRCIFHSFYLQSGDLFKMPPASRPALAPAPLWPLAGKAVKIMCGWMKTAEKTSLQSIFTIQRQKKTLTRCLNYRR